MFAHERPRACAQSVSPSRTDRVQGGLSPARFEESHVERPDKHGSDGEGTREPSELVLDVDRGRS